MGKFEKNIWNEVLYSCGAFKDYLDPVLEEEELFDKASSVQNITGDKIVKRNSKNTSTRDRWLEVFKLT